MQYQCFMGRHQQNTLKQCIFKQAHPSLPGEIEKVTVERKGADNNLASISIYYSGYDDCIEHAYSAANDWLEQLARNAESYITKCGKARLQDYITHCEGNEIELLGTIQSIGMIRSH